MATIKKKIQYHEEEKKQSQQPMRQTQGAEPNTAQDGALSDVISREQALPPSSPPSPSSNHLYHSHKALLLYVTVLLAGSTQGPPTRKRFCPLPLLSRGKAPLVWGTDADASSASLLYDWLLDLKEGRRTEMESYHPIGSKVRETYSPHQL